MSVFCFVDRVLEVKKSESVTAFFKLKGNEEFLQDHFEGFPVMPGVLLLESLRQAALSLLDFPGSAEKEFYRLSEARDVKFGQFVRPGSDLKISARLKKREKEAIFFEGRIDLMNAAAAAKVLSADFSLVPVDRCR